MNNKKFSVTATINVDLTIEDIDDIMVSALEGGINYWVGEAEVIEEKRVADWGHEQIARGGCLMLHDIEDHDTVWELNLEKFLKGFQLWLEKGYDWYDAVDVVSGVVDCGQIDAGCADNIVQLALFGEIQFG